MVNQENLGELTIIRIWLLEVPEPGLACEGVEWGWSSGFRNPLVDASQLEAESLACWLLYLLQTFRHSGTFLPVLPEPAVCSSAPSKLHYIQSLLAQESASVDPLQAYHIQCMLSPTFLGRFTSPLTTVFSSSYHICFSGVEYTFLAILKVSCKYEW